MTSPESIANRIPHALQELDKVYSGTLSSAYNVALTLSPDLKSLGFELHQGGPNFLHSKKGVADSKVYLPKSPNFYKAELPKLTFESSGVFGKLFEKLDIELTEARVAQVIMLHEMGHADALAAYIREADGDTLRGSSMYLNVQSAEKDKLPLKMYPSYAQYVWEENVEGYRDALRVQGMTDEQWAEVFLENYQAYTAMPSERRADNFAVRVLSIIYK